MKKLLAALSLVMIFGCQGKDNDSDTPSPTPSTPELSPPEPAQIPVTATPPAPEVFVKGNPESLIECVPSMQAGLFQQCRLLQPSIILAENPEHEMRTYQIEYEASCYRGRSEVLEIRIRAQPGEEGEVVGLIRTGKKESYIIRGTGDLVIEDFSPKALGYKTFSSDGCDLIVKVQKI